MEISMELNISAEYLFQRLIDTLIYDAKQETGRELTFEELKDLSYATSLDRQTKAKLKVTKFIPNKSYHIRLETPEFIKHEAYELTALAKDKVKVDYFEKQQAKQKLHSLRQRLTAPFRCSLRRHNFMKLLKELEIGY